MEEYLLVGGFIFWLYLAVVIVLLCVSVVKECAFCGALLIVFALGVLTKVFGADVPAYLPHDLLGWAMLVGAYLPIGVLWSLFKFYVTYKERIRELGAGKSTFKPGVVDPTWNDYVDREAPKASEMKAAIISWIAYWPISILIYVLADLLSDLLQSIYEYFSGVYERMGARIRDSIKDKE